MQREAVVCPRMFSIARIVATFASQQMLDFQNRKGTIYLSVKLRLALRFQMQFDTFCDKARWRSKLGASRF